MLKIVQNSLFLLVIIFMAVISCTEPKINDDFRKKIQNSVLPIKRLEIESNKERFDNMLVRLDSIDVHIYDYLHKFKELSSTLVEARVYELETDENINKKYREFYDFYGTNEYDTMLLMYIIIYEAGLKKDYNIHIGNI